MAQIAKASKAAAKKVAYQKKQEEGGKKAVNWIFISTTNSWLLTTATSGLHIIAAASVRDISAAVADVPSGYASVTAVDISPSRDRQAMAD